MDDLVNIAINLEPRPLFHLVLHAAVPAAIAFIWYRKRFTSAWLWMLAGWLIDIDHLLADPIYASGRCSIGFHPLHTTPAIAVYVLLLAHPRTRLLGIGLLVHIALDGIDCMLI